VPLSEEVGTMVIILPEYNVNVLIEGTTSEWWSSKKMIVE
jgi:hypothetical protein